MTDAALKGCAKGFQYGIACLVALFIINMFKVIQVYNEKGKILSIVILNAGTAKFLCGGFVFQTCQ